MYVLQESRTKSLIKALADYPRIADSGTKDGLCLRSAGLEDSSVDWRGSVDDVRWQAGEGAAESL